MENKTYRPKKGEIYYFASHLGFISIGIYDGSTVDKWFILQGNCFKTEEKAQQYLKNLKTKGELRELANELNGDEVIDWGNENQNKYRLFYNYDRHGVTWGAENNISKAQGAIYCLDEDFLLKAIERIGEQRLIEMIRSGV